MFKNRDINRNINKNITSYRNPGKDLFAKPYPGLTKMFSIIFAIIVPIVFILLATNIVFRMPDVYNFEISRTSALSEAEIRLTENEKTGAIGELISDYMRDNVDEFQINQLYHGEGVPLFTENDQKLIKNYRTFLNTTLTVMILLLLLSVFIYIFLYKTEWHRRLRKTYIATIIIYFGIILGLLWLFFDKSMTNNIINGIFKVSSKKDDILPLLFSDSFLIIILIVIIIISLTLLMVGNSVVRYMTKGSRMFD